MKGQIMTAKPEANPVPVEDEWETVSETRTKMLIDTDGDSFTGVWEGFEDVTNPHTGEVYKYANFRLDDNNLPVTTSASHELEEGLKDVPIGKRVRVTRTGQTGMGNGKNPMTNIRVEVSKR